MIPIALVGLVVVLAGVVGGMIYFKKKQRSAPLTPSSIPPMPTPQEANQHFTPANELIAAQPKKPINKKMIIAIAVLFNVILIGAVIFIGMSVSKKNATTAKNTPDTVAPTRVPTPTLAVPESSIPLEITPEVSESTAEATALQPTTAVVALSPTKAVAVTPVAATASASVAPTVAPTKVAVPTPTAIIVAIATSPTAVPTTIPTEIAVELPDAGNSFSLLILIIPAMLVAIAFIL